MSTYPGIQGSVTCMHDVFCILSPFNGDHTSMDVWKVKCRFIA